MFPFPHYKMISQVLIPVPESEMGTWLLWAHLWGLAGTRGLAHLEVANSYKMMVFVGLDRGLM